MSFEDIEELLRKYQERKEEPEKKEATKEKSKELEEGAKETKEREAKVRKEARTSVSESKAAATESESKVAKVKVKTSKVPQVTIVGLEAIRYERIRRDEELRRKRIEEFNEIYEYAAKRNFKPPSIFSKERWDKYSKYNWYKWKLKLLLGTPPYPSFVEERKWEICKLVKFFRMGYPWNSYCREEWEFEKQIKKKLRHRIRVRVTE